MSKSKQILQEAQDSYEEGNWLKAITFLTNKSADNEYKVLPIFIENELAEAQKIIGLSLYYVAIKDFREIEDKKAETCAKAEIFLRSALENTDDKDIRISVINFLPLVLWIQGKQDEALKVSNSATSEFGNISSVWSTLSILYNWSGEYEKSVEVCEMVYKTALDAGNFRTAGHGKHNQGDALKKLGIEEEAKKAYKKANELYLKFEEGTGQKATVHINGVIKKISQLA